MSNLRMLIAEWLMGKAVSVAPKTDEGYYLIACVGQYMEFMINQRDK